MEEDNRPEERSDEEEESDGGWYFDLPSGAWERQEAKNRELRQSVRRNMDTPDPRKDVFAAKKDVPDEDESGYEAPAVQPSAASEPLRATEPAPTFESPGANQETPASETAPAFEPPQANDPVPSATHAATNDDDRDPLWEALEERSQEAGAEPISPGPLPLRLRSQRDEPEDHRPALKPPPGLFAEAGEDDAPRAADAVPEGPRAESLGHGSRWEAAFNDPSDRDSSFLDGMRAWSSGGREGPEPAAAEPARADAVWAPATPPDDEPLYDEAAPSLKLRPQRHDEPEAPIAAEGEPKSRWDEVFSAKAGDDLGMLDSMRQWASKPQAEDDAPRRVLDDEHEKPVPEELLKPFAWETAADSRQGDAQLREAAWETPREPASAYPEPPPGFEWEEDAVAASQEWDALARAEEAVEKKPGMFGRLFGRKKKQELPASAPFVEPAEAAWEMPGEDRDQAILPPAMHFASDEESSEAGLPATWEPEDQGPVAPPVRPSFDEREESAPAPGVAHDEPESDDQSRRPSPWLTAGAATASTFAVDRLNAMDFGLDRDAPAAEESSAPGDSWSTEGNDDTWSPEPDFASTGEASHAAREPNDESPALTHVADEDPWQAVSAVETDETADQPEVEPTDEHEQRGATIAAAGAFAAVAHAADDDDPWASFMDSHREEPGQAPAHEERPPDPPEDVEVNDADAEADSDDPWAAIATVTGYEATKAGFAVYKPDDEVEAALGRREAERAAEDAAVAMREERPQTAAAPPDHAAAELAPVELPEWDDSNIEDDTVLRAFQAHASGWDHDEDEVTGPSTARVSEPAVFDELLGEDADALMTEASDSPDSSEFGRTHGWAPQRSANPGERAPYPWEPQVPVPVPAQGGEDLEGWSRVESPLGAPRAAATVEGSVAAHGDTRHGRTRAKTLVREIVETGLLALLVFLAVRASFQNFKVDGLSMYPTLEDGQYLIVNKLEYAQVDTDRLAKFIPFVEANGDKDIFGGPNRGDIIVLKDPADPQTDLIKRIIGMPGETMQIVDGKVYINGYYLEEPYIEQTWHDNMEATTIPEGTYFVMGDNRSNSKDSRNSQIGVIPRDYIIGKAMLSYWPREQFGLAPNEEGNLTAEPVLTTRRLGED